MKLFARPVPTSLLARIVCVALVIVSLPLAERPAAALDSSLPFYFAWGAAGTGDGQFLGAQAVAVNSSGMVYVLETAGTRVQKFDPLGNFIGSFGSAGSGNGQFNTPRGIAVDPSGNVYVTDAGNNRVQKFTGTGVYVTQWGTAGVGNGQFSSPLAIATDAGGNVYVTEAGSNRVQKFTSVGGFVVKWGAPGTGNGQFNNPNGIAIAPGGNVYVSDYLNYRIQVFTNLGGYLTQWGSIGSAPGQFGILRGVAVGKDGSVYVNESGSPARVEKFSANGAYLGASHPGGTNLAIFNLGGLALDPLGNVYVCDAGNDRMVKFAHLERIASITDVTNDQGRQVRIRISSCGADTVGSGTPILGYEIYRQISAANGLQLAAARARVAPAATFREGWDYVATIPARGDTSYSMVIPTLADSNSTGSHWSSFFVSATTALPAENYFCTQDSGYSVDNLPPAPPASFLAAYSSGATALHWVGNSEPDFWYYRLYRGTSAAFVPSSGNLIATRSDTGYADPGGAGNYYKLSAVDVNGNESGYSLVTPAGTLDVPGGGALAFALFDPSPNPAGRSRLMVEFVLPTARAARLELIDVSGRVAAAIDAGALGAGRHSIDLATGHRLAPGVYLVRLTQDARAATRRVVLLD